MARAGVPPVPASATATGRACPAVAAAETGPGAFAGASKWISSSETRSGRTVLREVNALFFFLALPVFAAVFFGAAFLLPAVFSLPAVFLLPAFFPAGFLPRFAGAEDDFFFVVFFRAGPAAFLAVFFLLALAMTGTPHRGRLRACPPASRIRPL